MDFVGDVKVGVVNDLMLENVVVIGDNVMWLVVNVGNWKVDVELLRWGFIVVIGFKEF